MTDTNGKGGSSQKGKNQKPSREDRLAEQLRANLRRRKQATRKSQSKPDE